MESKYLAKANLGLDTLNRRLSRVQCLSGNGIKWIAIATMFVDHFSKIVLLWVQGFVWGPMLEAGQMTSAAYTKIDDFIFYQLYGIGSIAFPLFCFLLVEGFCHTRHRKRYFGLMALFALVSELPFDWGIFAPFSRSAGSYPFYWDYQNVFFTLLFGLCALWCLEKFQFQADAGRREKIKAGLLRWGGVAAMAGAAALLHTDYGAYGVVLIAALYLGRRNRIAQVLLFLLAYAVAENAQPTIYQMLSVLAMLLYNGQRGKVPCKYGFYLFYPIHLVLLRAVTLVLVPFAT